MTFRDNRFAQDEREKTELRDKVRDGLDQIATLKEENAKLSQKITEQLHAEEYAAIRGPSLLERFFTWLDNLRISIVTTISGLFSLLGRAIAWPFVVMSDLTLIQLMFLVSILGIGISIGFAVWHEFEDPRDGYVTGKNFYPEHESCGWEEECTGSGRDRSCTDVYRCHTIPPRWTVDIGYQGTAATWDVEQDDYNHVERGQWFCARDILHTEACIEPHQ